MRTKVIMQDKRSVTLSVPGTILRPWKIGDAAWYVDARDEEIFRWTTEKQALTVEELEAAILRVNASEDVISWAIVDSQSLELMGNIALVFNAVEQSAEVSYFLAPWGRGRGHATAAVTAACAWTFANLAVERITLRTHPDNVRSQQVALRVGFQRLQHGAQADEAVDQEDDNESSPFTSWFELSKRSA